MMLYAPKNTPSMMSCVGVKIHVHIFDKFIVLLVNVKNSYLNTYFKIKIIDDKIILFFLYIKIYL